MNAQKTGGEKQLNQPFSILDSQYLLPASPEPSSIYNSLQRTMCCLEKQSACQKHCDTPPLLMVIQMCFDDLQPELPDLHRAHDSNGVHTQQFCTAHTLNQVPPGCLSFQASMDCLYSRKTVCPDCVPNCQISVTSLGALTFRNYHWCSSSFKWRLMIHWDITFSYQGPAEM